MNRTMRHPLTFALLLLPTLALYVIFFVYPVLQSFYYGFTSWDGVSKAAFVGLDNFSELAADPKFWKAFLNNIWLILFSCCVQVPLIVTFSLLIGGVKRWQSFYKTAVFVPSILSTAVIGILWSFIYEPQVGLLNQALQAVGLPPVYWLSDPDWAFVSILITNGWQWTGFYIVLVLAAILAIPKELNEAVAIDGASGWQKALYITVPLIRGIIMVVILLSITGAMKAADIILVMTKGGPFGSTDVMATYMINRSFQLFRYGYGAAVAVLIFVFTLLLTAVFKLLTRGGERIEY
ncbi:carbohydrate ABC transporter permease [Paenibacillus chartarius]|uniref:Carbohydrate ABC transporter permease n=1 Tax=Paenibacillus chartarius TaxID=747481 RepID=A0ABV6DH91_9BACL